MSNNTPTPEPSEVAETTAGEREAACPWCHYGDPHPTFSECPAEPHAGEVEALAKVLAEHDAKTGPITGMWACACGAASDDTPVSAGGPDPGARRADYRAHLATHLAALFDRVRREEGERIAQAIEAGVLPSHPNEGYKDGFRRAAQIARAASVGRGEGQ